MVVLWIYTILSANLVSVLINFSKQSRGTEEWNIEEILYWKRVSELAFPLAESQSSLQSLPLCTTSRFSLSLQGWADLPGDSATPTWQSSNALPSILPLTHLSAQLTSSLGLGTIPRASGCRRNSILSLAPSVPSEWRCKKGKADRCPSKATAAQ